jgi:hypothetical protein
VTTAPNHDIDANSTNAGAVYVFTRSGSDWYEEAKLVSNRTSRNHYFGRSVSISGDSVVVGDRAFDGIAHVFSRQHTACCGPIWSEEQKLMPIDARGGDEFGRSVAVSGGIAIVGAPNGQLALNYAGAAYIFVRSGTQWSQEAKIWGSDTQRGHYFGDSVAISGDTVAVGTSPVVFGAVYVFTRSGQSWRQQAKIISPKGLASGDAFGSSLGLYHHTLVIGAPNSNEGGSESGAVYVFLRSASHWSQKALLVAHDTMAGLRFGRDVSIYGNMIAVAAEGGRDNLGNFAGIAYMFSRAGGNWSAQGKVVDTDTIFGDRFGNSIGTSGKYLAVGAPRKNHVGPAAGITYIMRCTTTTTTTSTTMTYAPFGFYQPGFYGDITTPRANGRGAATASSSTKASCFLLTYALLLQASTFY